MNRLGTDPLRSGTTSLGHFPALDGLRGVAIAAVVVYHFLPGQFSGGFLGLDLFFVLSGFLITSLLLESRRSRGSVDIRGFYSRRFRRLMPAALLTLAAIAILAPLLSAVTVGLRLDLLSALGYVANWRFAFSGQSYVAQFSDPSPVRHFWSLAVEEQFYLVWPLVMAAGSVLAARFLRAGLRRPVAVVVLALAALGSAGLMWYWYDPFSDPSRLYYGTDTRAFELLIGALAAVVVGHPRRVRGGRPLLAVGLLAAAGCLVPLLLWSADSSAYYRGGAFLWACGAALVIVSCLPESSPLGKALSLRPLCWLGLISYGVYLFHWPMQLWLTPDRVGLHGPALFVLKVSATVALAALSYWLLERPIRRGRGVISRLPPLVVAPVAVSGVLVLALVAVPPVTRLEQGVEVAESSLPFVEHSTLGESGASPFSALGQLPGEAQQPAGPAEALDIPSLPSAMAEPSSSELDELEAQSNEDFVLSCLTPKPIAVHRDNGAGELVAVVGDSITNQIRDLLISDTRYDWFVLSGCAVSAADLARPDDSRAKEVIEPAFDELIDAAPDRLVVLLGSSDVVNSSPGAYGEIIEAVGERTRTIECRSWVKLSAFAVPGISPERGTNTETFNVALAEVAVRDGWQLWDWDGLVKEVPHTETFHPWLSPIDGVHVSAGLGKAALLNFITSELGADDCPAGSA